MKPKKTVCGVGTNDADYAVYKYENYKLVWICPYYRAWKSMIVRAYNDKLKNKRQTYRDVSVCEEWHSFMCFRSWMAEQDWEGKHLDKDILVQGNKVYSPNACVFVEGFLNNFITDAAAARGEWPLGVYWHGRDKKFQSQCNNPFTKKLEHLGCFHCPNQAHQAWRARKHELACQLADIQTDQRVADALRARYN